VAPRLKTAAPTLSNSAPTPVPENFDDPLPSAVATPSQRVNAVMEIIKEERRATYALLQQVTMRERDEKNIDIVFSFPAHRELMMTGNHKALLESSLQRVYGEGMQYHLLTGQETSSAPQAQVVDLAPIEERIREWLGPDVPIKHRNG
jgi:DNA polymerase-3 subunit gamma/tau